MNQKELYRFWKEHIDKPIYRVIPSNDYKKIKREGIDPKKDPYKEIKKDVLKLRKIVGKLEKQGFTIIQHWGKMDVTGTHSLDVTLRDFNINCIDFSPKKEDISYYMSYPGGAATTNLIDLTNKLMKRKNLLSREEISLVSRLIKWLNKRVCKNIATYAMGSSKIFEGSYFAFQKKIKKKLFKKAVLRKYIESPFGPFEHFLKVIKREGLRKYAYYLRRNKFYLRVRNKIPSEEIKVLR